MKVDLCEVDGRTCHALRNKRYLQAAQQKNPVLTQESRKFLGRAYKRMRQLSIRRPGAQPVTVLSFFLKRRIFFIIIVTQDFIFHMRTYIICIDLCRESSHL